MSKNNYQTCNNCIVDTSDSNILFDENGQCEYCTNYYKNSMWLFQKGTNFLKSIGVQKAIIR